MVKGFVGTIGIEDGLDEPAMLAVCCLKDLLGLLCCHVEVVSNPLLADIWRGRDPHMEGVGMIGEQDLRAKTEQDQRLLAGQLE